MSKEIQEFNPQEIKTMSSSQLAEMLHMEKSHVNRDIKKMFDDKIMSSIIGSSIDTRGYVTDYYLPELESKMFVAKKNINYLEKITQFWIDQNKQELTPCEILLENAKRLVAQERELKALRDRQDVVEREQFETKAQLSALFSGEDFFTVVGYCRSRGLCIDVKKASFIGKKAASMCRERGIDIGTAPHPVYGKINSYPRDILDIVVGV